MATSMSDSHHNPYRHPLQSLYPPGANAGSALDAVWEDDASSISTDMPNPFDDGYVAQRNVRSVPPPQPPSRYDLTFASSSVPRNQPSPSSSSNAARAPAPARPVSVYAGPSVPGLESGYGYGFNPFQNVDHIAFPQPQHAPPARHAQSFSDPRSFANPNQPNHAHSFPASRPEHNLNQQRIYPRRSTSFLSMNSVSSANSTPPAVPPKPGDEYAQLQKAVQLSLEESEAQRQRELDAKDAEFEDLKRAMQESLGINPDDRPLPPPKPEPLLNTAPDAGPSQNQNTNTVEPEDAFVAFSTQSPELLSQDAFSHSQDTLTRSLPVLAHVPGQSVHAASSPGLAMNRRASSVPPPQASVPPRVRSATSHQSFASPPPHVRPPSVPVPGHIPFANAVASSSSSSAVPSPHQSPFLHHRPSRVSVAPSAHLYAHAPSFTTFMTPPEAPSHGPEGPDPRQVLLGIRTTALETALPEEKVSNVVRPVSMAITSRTRPPTSFRPPAQPSHKSQSAVEGKMGLPEVTMVRSKSEGTTSKNENDSEASTRHGPRRESALSTEKSTTLPPEPVTAIQLVPEEFLKGVSMGFGPAPINTSQKPMEGPIPDLISLPFEHPPFYVQGPSWRSVLKLLARLSSTRIEPSLTALAKVRGEMRLRIVVSFVKVHSTSQAWHTAIYMTIDHPVPLDVSSRFRNGDTTTLPYSYSISSPIPVLADGADMPLAKFYTVPSLLGCLYPTLPVTFPDIATYLASALEISRTSAYENQPGIRRLGKLVDSLYPAEKYGMRSEERPGLGKKLRSFVGLGSKPVRSRNSEMYDLVTPFVPDEYGR